MLAWKQLAMSNNFSVFELEKCSNRVVNDCEKKNMCHQANEAEDKF